MEVQMMVKPIKSEVHNRRCKLKPRYRNRIGTLYHEIKTDKYGKNIQIHQNPPTTNKFDKDFEEGLKDLFENYDTTLKNLVNK